MYKNLTALLSGVLFGLGLAISEMINPLKVKAFLDVTGQWDPSLILVMISAIAVTFTSYRIIFKSPKPLLSKEFHLPNRTEIDHRLIGGAAVFGVGWGLVGFCPGPSIAALVNGNLETIIFAAALITGMFVSRLYPKQ